LQGLRVLDLTRVIAGPVATRTLAAWGADVLRVDSPRLPELEAQCIDTLSGKRSALLDAASAPDRARLEELVSAADVVVQGYRPGALARFGLDPSSLAQRHPHLTVITLSAWGDTGPWAQRRGFDSLVQAPTGIAAAESSVPGEPGALPAQVLDHATGYLAAAAAAMSVAGILTGQPPQHRTLSLAQTAAWLMSEPARPCLRGSEPEVPARDGADAWLVDVPGPDGDVTVIGPPGRLGEHIPAWTATTRFGHDAPSYCA
jgi:crotonobetainyl-CoA:carnitine CoA-transferase CaiB-like acyl-CoA transferase